MTTTTKTQTLKAKIISYACTGRNSLAGYELALDTLSRFMDKMVKLGGFTGQVATTIAKTMGNAYSPRVAVVSEKQAYIIARAAVENGIEF